MTEKKWLVPRFFTLILVCLPALAVGACLSEGTKNGEAPIQTINDNGPADRATGSFKKIAADSQEAVNAFMFLKAVMAQTRPELTLDALSGAESQVVAGYNYRLICDAHDNKGKKMVITAVIYRNLDGVYRLTDLRFQDK
jgi:hypothetical protein